MDALADTTTWYYYDDQRRRQYTAGWVPSSLQIWGNFYAFTGRELDWLDGGNLQVMYYRARYYDPDTGRFLQHDPLGIDPAGGNGNPFRPTGQYADGMNGYEYVRINPQIHLDPHGKSIRSIVDGIAKLLGCGIYIYCRDNENMPPPLNNIDHCHPVLSSKDESDMTKPDAKTYPVTVVQWGLIKFGPAAGKPCKCATCSDIKACVAKGRSIGYHGIWPYIRGRNCQGANAKALMGCCLRSTWRPTAPIGELCRDYEPML